MWYFTYIVYDNIHLIRLMTCGITLTRLMKCDSPFTRFVTRGDPLTRLVICGVPLTSHIKEKIFMHFFTNSPQHTQLSYSPSPSPFPSQAWLWSPSYSTNPHPSLKEGASSKIHQAPTYLFRTKLPLKFLLPLLYTHLGKGKPLFYT